MAETEKKDTPAEDEPPKEEDAPEIEQAEAPKEESPAEEGSAKDTESKKDDPPEEKKATKDEPPEEKKPKEDEPPKEKEATKDESPEEKEPKEDEPPKRKKPKKEGKPSAKKPEEDEEVPTADEPKEPIVESAEDVEEQLAERKVPKINLPEELEKVAGRRGDEWVPRTRLGRLVKSGKVSSMSEALATGLPLREPEIVDILLPDLADEVMDVNMVQRMTDSGRRVRFSIMTVVGNRNGFVGIGMAKGREVGPSIRRAIDNAKLNILEIRRGCGSWECGCGTPHTVPFAATGKCASVEITIKPAPRGVGVAVGEIPRKVLELAGVKDAWGFARGQTRTTVNGVKATMDALSKVSIMRVHAKQAERTPVVKGPVGGARETHTPEPEPEPEAEGAEGEEKAVAAGGEAS